MSMVKLVAIVLMVWVNHLVAYQLGIDTFLELFWLMVASFSGMLYGVVAVLNSKVVKNNE